jgi:hypothetical protein
VWKKYLKIIVAEKRFCGTMGLLIALEVHTMWYWSDGDFRPGYCGGFIWYPRGWHFIPTVTIVTHT